MEAKMLLKNKKIRNTSISLDGGTFEHCDFDNCEIIFSGYLPVHLNHCKFGPDVKWSFVGGQIWSIFGGFDDPPRL